MSLWSKIRGTAETIWQIGLGGPLWKQNSSNIDARNSADAAYVNVRGADPTIADDLVTKRYGDANYGGSSVIESNTKILSSNFTLPTNTSAYVSGTFEVASGFTLEVAGGATFEVG